MDERGATLLCDLATLASGPVSTPSAESTSSLYLIVLRGDVPGRMIRLAPGTQDVGRSAESRIAIPDMNVSRKHARLMVDSDGLVWLTDEGSTNGTMLNGQRLGRGQTVGVRDGDRISFGPSVVLKFVRTDAVDERHHREMFERSVRDGLTGLYNRPYFETQVDILAQNVFRRDQGLAVLLLDLDHFKRINDTYGHDAGDDVLREVARRLRHSTRADDLVARYGGEEFVAALPIATPEQARDRAVRIRDNLRSHPIETQGHALIVTASIGLSYAAPDHPQSTSHLLAMADKSLYKAKETGRNRVCFFGGMPPDRPTPLERLEGFVAKAGATPGALTTVDFEVFRP